MVKPVGPDCAKNSKTVVKCILDTEGSRMWPYILFKVSVALVAFHFFSILPIPKRIMRPDFIAIFLTLRGKCELADREETGVGIAPMRTVPPSAHIQSLSG